MNASAGKQDFAYADGDRRYVGTLLEGPATPSAAVVLLPDWRGQGALAHAHAADLVAGLRDGEWVGRSVRVDGAALVGLDA